MERVLLQTPIRPEIIADNVLTKIVKIIASPTGKINMERVCRRFGKFAKNPEAWSNITFIEIDRRGIQDQETTYATKTTPRGYMQLTKLSFTSAVHSIFTRIRHIKMIHISSDQKSSTNRLCRSLFQAIMAQGIKAYRHFKKQKLEGVL